MQSLPIKTILIANRGEIAVRIIRAARELGMATVQVHSSADRGSLAVRMADTAVEVGPPQAMKSYLNTEAILQAAREQDADAIHPGYGFFSENADFADAVVEAGLIFIGPAGDTIRAMGDKARARRAAEAAGVPTLPGSPGRIDNIDEARKIARDIGFPVMIKAAAGGGGRGIRVIESPEDFKVQAPRASAEAEAAFGDGGLYLEKYISRARHIEAQILGDGERAIHLLERECSLQRRRQKVWEEAPSASLSNGARDRLCGAAVKLAEAVGYRGAGTVEFLYDDHTQEFYFIEMNTRIQVEHPVSEWITGVDLVREMIRIAGGERLRFDQAQIQGRGHAIEARINAEDPARDFMPSPGVISEVNFPQGPGVRFDGLIYSGCVIPPFYDSLLGKLIVWDEDRPAALRRLRRALAEFRIGGVPTTKPLFEALVNEPDIHAGRFDTTWLERWLETSPASLTRQD